MCKFFVHFTVVNTQLIFYLYKKIEVIFYIILLFNHVFIILSFIHDYSQLALKLESPESFLSIFIIERRFFPTSSI